MYVVQYLRKCLHSWEGKKKKVFSKQVKRNVIWLIEIHVLACMGHKNRFYLHRTKSSKCIGIESAGLCWFEMSYFQKVV